MRQKGLLGVNRDYTARLQKGGAVLNEIRMIVRNWTNNESWEEQSRRIIEDNILGKKSISRAKDVYSRVFLHRFLKGNPPEAWKIVRVLEDVNAPLEILTPVYYWITARSDELLYDFVINDIMPRSRSHDQTVRVEETAAWLKNALAGQGQKWADSVIPKMSRALLAALRDFGILEGAAKKKIAPIFLPAESFAYLAFTLSKLGKSGASLINHPDWNLFLMGKPLVERIFVEAHQKGFLRYDAAGNIYRIEFDADTYKEMADVIS